MVNVAIDSKQYFHNTFDALINHSAWNGTVSPANSNVHLTSIKKLAMVIIKPVHAEKVQSLGELGGIVRQWMYVNSAELDYSDKARFAELRKLFHGGKTSFKDDGLELLAVDPSHGLKAEIFDGIDPQVSVFHNYEQLKRFCLSKPLKIELVKRHFMRTLFEQYPELDDKKALALNCIMYPGPDVWEVQELFCSQLKHLKIPDEAVSLELATLVLAQRPDLFIQYFSSFGIFEEVKRLLLAITALHTNLELFVEHYALFKIQTDQSKFQMALEAALFDPEFARLNRGLFHLTNFEHRALFDRFLVAQTTCGIVFKRDADPSRPQYQQAMEQWIHLDFSPVCNFPADVVENWSWAIFYLLEKKMDVKAAQKIIQWALDRDVITKDCISDFAKIEPSNLVHLLVALYAKDPKWASETFIIDLVDINQ